MWGTVKPKWTAMDVAVLNSPGIAALAALEAQTSKLALNSAIAPLTSVATQLSTISDALASATLANLSTYPSASSAVALKPFQTDVK